MLRRFPNSNISASSQNPSPRCLHSNNAAASSNQSPTYGHVRPRSTSPQMRPGLNTTRCSPRLCLSTQSSSESVVNPTLRYRRGNSFFEKQKQQTMTTELIENSQEEWPPGDMVNLSEIMSGATLNPAEWFTDNEQAALLSALRRLLEQSKTSPNEIPATVDELLDAVGYQAAQSHQM
eukprot:6211396-Pleurochrysis_carterae.AAC.2